MDSDDEITEDTSPKAKRRREDHALSAAWFRPGTLALLLATGGSVTYYGHETKQAGEKLGEVLVGHEERLKNLEANSKNRDAMIEAVARLDARVLTVERRQDAVDPVLRDFTTQLAAVAPKLDALHRQLERIQDGADGKKR